MEAFFHHDPRIEEWVDQIVEKLFTVCLLGEDDAESEFKKGSQIVAKLAVLFKEMTDLPTEHVYDGLKQLVEQQLPDKRVINNFPTFLTTMERMLLEGMPKQSEPLQTSKMSSDSSPHVIIQETKGTQDTHGNQDIQDTQNTQNSKGTHEILSKSISHDDEEQQAIAALAMSSIQSILDSDIHVFIDDIDLQAKEIKTGQPSVPESPSIDTLSFISTGPSLGTESRSGKESSSGKETALGKESASGKETALEKEIQSGKESTLRKEAGQGKETSSGKEYLTIDEERPLSTTARVIRSSQVPKGAERLKLVLNQLYPDAPVRWNIALGGETFLAQVEDILISIEERDQARIKDKFSKEGWMVFECRSEDLAFPRRLERGLRQLRRPNKTKNSPK